MNDDNWQKVRVAFDDADGNRVEAVMWKLPKSPIAWASHDPLLTGFDTSEDGVTVIRIYDLPTGVGAVIRFGDNYGDARDLYVSDVSGKWWSNSDGDTYSSQELLKHGGYEVLSEGIQLGGAQ